MNVIGIDPAPAKKAAVFCRDNFSKLDAPQLPQFVHELAKIHDDLLLCWDAPLTGGGSGYYSRPIERFFRKGEWKTPKGISVRGYAGCPHWAVSQAAFGLPRIGNFAPDPDSLPFRLIASGGPPGPTHGKRKYVVEVHPAVAIWLWCSRGRSRQEIDSWEYKKNKGTLGKLWATLKKKLELKTNFSPKNDDHLDAYVAYLLGTMWLAKRGVVLLGDERSGSFLVPENKKLLKAFEKYRNCSASGYP